jgi:hypothetical protein
MPMPRPLLFGSLFAVSMLSAPLVLAGEVCEVNSQGNNPAFAQAKPCPPAARPAKTVRPATSDTRVEKRDGATVYGFGDTSVAVSGYVRSDSVIRRRSDH